MTPTLRAHMCIFILKEVISEFNNSVFASAGLKWNYAPTSGRALFLLFDALRPPCADNAPLFIPGCIRRGLPSVTWRGKRKKKSAVRYLYTPGACAGVRARAIFRDRRA